MTREAPDADYATLALAGVVQAAILVHRTALGEGVDPTARDALLESITTQHASDLAEVFPDPSRFRFGASVAAEAIAGRSGAPEVVRYTLQLLELAMLLRRVPQVIEKLGGLLDGLAPGACDTAEFARIYQQTISTLGKRIQVTGDAEILRREETAERIRALLLAGVRMAWLWTQMGGRRRHLLLRRRQLAMALRALAG